MTREQSTLRSDGRQSDSPVLASQAPVEVLTFGCRLNTLESEVMRTRALDAGLDNTVLVNTCAVTGEAVRQARQGIRKARRDNPNARIVVSGCAAQIDQAAFSRMPEVDAVLGNEEKLHVAGYRAIGAGARTVDVSDIMAVTDLAVPDVRRIAGRSRAFVQIQNGCDHRCTFCIIPHGRGNSRSIPLDGVISQARRLVDAGHGEIVLTGIDLTSYGADLPETPTLGLLVRRLLKQVPELRRLRLSSIDSIEVDTHLLDAIAEEDRLMPHLHLSLQAGHDLTLRRMKRRHLSDDAVRFCTEARRLRPGIVFGADLIAGFPTETEEMFQGTLDHVDACGLTHLHVFPFSSRPGTPAARMPQLDRSVIKGRAARLREHGRARYLAHLARELGRCHVVLGEAPDRGRTECFTPARVTGLRPGQLANVTVVGHDGDRLDARLDLSAFQNHTPAQSVGDMDKIDETE